MGGHVCDCCALTKVNNLCNSGNTLVYITLTVNNSPLLSMSDQIYRKKLSLKFSGISYSMLVVILVRVLLQFIYNNVFRT